MQRRGAPAFGSPTGPLGSGGVEPVGGLESERISLVPYDLAAFIRRVEATNANLNCLCCGSSDVAYSDKRAVLFDLDEYDRTAADAELALAAGTICGVRMCPECGYVHLHSFALLEEGQADGL